MCVMSAGALCIPAGTHFLLEGRASSLPSRFHIPSSSRGVRWTLTAGLSDCCSDSSSSLPSPSSSCSLAEPGGFFRPGTRNESHVPFTTNLHWKHHPYIYPLGLCSYRCPASVSETLVWGRRSWSYWRHNAPTHTSPSRNRRGNGTSLEPVVEVKKALDHHKNPSLPVIYSLQKIVSAPTRVLSSMLQMFSCIGMLKLCRKFPPNTIESTGV